MTSFVVDTNVPVVANDRDGEYGSDCVLRAIGALEEVRSGCLLVDGLGLVFDEYRLHLSPKGQPGPGDAFYKWAWTNQGFSERVRLVVISEDPGRGFVEFPADPLLDTFDPSDRKFVAVALASGVSPQVLNATDSDWWIHREALTASGVVIRFVCPERFG